MSIEFGDIDVDDVWDSDPTIAPEQVTYRLHELRVAIDELAGRPADAWDELTDPEQQLALALGNVIVDWIGTHLSNDPATLAEQLHNVRAWLARGLIPAWADLDDDDRQLAVDIMTMIVDWLEREGPR